MTPDEAVAKAAVDRLISGVIPAAGYDAPMDDQPSRPELDAKLELIETRMDGRINLIQADIAAIKEGNRETRDLVRGLKTTMIVTAIGSVLTTVFGIAAFNATVLSNMVASFESGKSTATAITQATEQLKATQEQLRAIEARLTASAPR